MIYLPQTGQEVNRKKFAYLPQRRQEVSLKICIYHTLSLTISAYRTLKK